MRILSTTQAADTGATAQIISELRGGYRAVQVEITAAASVQVLGRVNPSMPWVTLATFTASGADMVATLREMSASVTDNTGLVNVELDI